MIVPPFEHDTLRRKPYIWVSWITKLLAGEDRCWWKAWYKSHYQSTKTPEDPAREDFFREYNKKHDAITQRRARELTADGFTVQIEDENSFKLRGQNADLAGKPDLVALKDTISITLDSKSGKRRQSDHWQVLVYLFGLPMSWLKTTDNRGEVAYKDVSVLVRSLGPAEREAIVAAIKKVSDSDAPEAEPSPWECKYCDVARCPVRYVAHEGDASRLF